MVRYLNPTDHNPRRITKADKNFAKRLNFKIRDIHKLEKNNSIGISVFGYENKEKYPTHLSKKFWEEKHVELLLIGEVEKKHYVLINDFNRFMYDYLLHHGRIHFCRDCLHAFSTK